MKKKLNSSTIRRFITIGLVIALTALFSLLSSNFLSMYNLSELFRNAAYLGLIACGLSVVMVGGGIDLSVGGIVCATGIICVHLSDIGLSGYMVLILGIITGGAFGLLNGFIVTKLKLTEFVTTLASGFLFFGLGLVFAYRDDHGTLMAHSIKSNTYLSLGQPLLPGGFYLISLVWVVLAIILWVVMHKTELGLYTFAIGSDEKSARMSGVNVAKIKVIGFIMSGAFSGLAAVFVTAYERTASTSLGNMREFLAIAACVVGGVVLGGGKGDAVSAFLGALFLAMLDNGLRKFGMDSYVVYMIQGSLILVAIAFDSQFAKISYRRRVKEQRLSAQTLTS
ncbi:MAG: ABC transporter permease [Clostridiales Family XIII bacterium]|jgi:ribose transport system permease protein|nr:ABC transporter permease [Clostridiales Family XIII bacterium]